MAGRAPRVGVLALQGDVREHVAVLESLDAEVSLVRMPAQLAEAERRYLTDFSPDLRPIPIVRARILTGHGRLAEARASVERLGVHDERLELAMKLEEIALKDDYFVERKLYPNVDFYTGLIYQAMGLGFKAVDVAPDLRRPLRHHGIKRLQLHDFA